MKNDIIAKDNKITKKETVNKGTATKVLATAGATLLQILLSSVASSTLIGSISIIAQLISAFKKAKEDNSFNHAFLVKIATEIDNNKLVVDKELDDKFSGFYKSVCGSNFIPKKKLYEQLVEFAVKVDEGCGKEELNTIGNEKLKALVEILVESTKLQVEESISDDIKLYVQTEIEKNSVTRTNIVYDAGFPFENVNFIKREDDNKIDLLEKIDIEFSKNRIVVITSTSDNNHLQFPGGIGKTTLAVQYLRGQIENNKELKFKAVTFNNDNAKYDDLLKKVLGINENTLQNEKEKLLEEFADKDDDKIIFIDNVNILDDEFCYNLIQHCGKRVLITARSFSNDSLNISKIELSEFDYENARKLFFDLYKPDYDENDEKIFTEIIYNGFCGGNAKGLELIAKILKNANITLEEYVKDFNEINVNVTSPVQVNGNYKENTFNEKIVELFKLSSIFSETDEEVNNKTVECFRIMIYAGMNNLPFNGLKEFFGFKPYLNNTFIDRLVKNGLITVTGDNKFFHTHPIVVQALKAFNIDETIAEERTKLFVFCQLGGVHNILPNIKVAVIPNGVKYLADYAFFFHAGVFDTKFLYDIEYSCTRLVNRSGLERVIIPDSVESIGRCVFRDCEFLTSVSMGSGVAYIGYEAFEGCSSLTEVFLGNGLKSVGESAFANCDKLEKIILPNCLEEIGGGAFSDCKSLTSVEIPNSVTSIGEHAFSFCRSLTSITIPNSVTSIGSGAFRGCSSLTSITIPNSVTSIGSYAFDGCSSLTSIEIPNSVTSIGSSAFYNCSSLTSIEIPNSVTSIGGSAFADCDSLTSIVVNENNKNYKSIDGNLYSKDGKTLIQYAKGKTNTSFTITETVTSIGDYAFYDCSSLTSIEIPNSVTSIGSSAFFYCISLTSITIPNSVTSIGSSAFRGCSLLTSITIGNSVTSIGDVAFYDCNLLTSITIGNSVTSIGSSAFRGCSILKNVYYNGSREEWKKIEIEEGNECLLNAEIIFLGDEE